MSRQATEPTSDPSGFIVFVGAAADPFIRHDMQGWRSVRLTSHSGRKKISQPIETRWEAHELIVSLPCPLYPAVVSIPPSARADASICLHMRWWLGLLIAPRCSLSLQ